MDNLVTEPVAKPWYLSKAVLGLIAGILLATFRQLANTLGIPLPEGLTEVSTLQFLTIVIPMGVGIYGRLVATHRLTATADKAEAINAVAASDDTP